MSGITWLLSCLHVTYFIEHDDLSVQQLDNVELDSPMDVSGSPQALRQARLMVMSGAVSLITLQASPASSPGSCRACAAEGDSHPRASTPLGPTLASRSYCHLVHNQSLGPPGFKGWGNPLSIGEQTCRSTSQGGMSHGPPCALSIGALPQGAAGLWWPFVPPPRIFPLPVRGQLMPSGCP